MKIRILSNSSVVLRKQHLFVGIFTTVRILGDSKWHIFQIANSKSGPSLFFSKDHHFILPHHLSFILSKSNLSPFITAAPKTQFSEIKIED